jgi:hypothetical protein
MEEVLMKLTDAKASEERGVPTSLERGVLLTVMAQPHQQEAARRR